MNPLGQAGSFLVKVVFDLYVFVILLRLLSMYVYANQFNPVTQFIMRATRYPCAFLRRITPKWHNVDLGIIFYVIVLEMFKLFLLMVLTGHLPQLLGLFVWGLGETIAQVLNLVSYLIIVAIVLSWIMLAKPGVSPVLSIFNQLADPFLAPARRLIPALGGLDFSPVIVLIVIQLLVILVASPIATAGMRLCFG